MRFREPKQTCTVTSPDSGEYHAVSEDTHWTPFINATVTYIRQVYPQPWNRVGRKPPTLSGFLSVRLCIFLASDGREARHVPAVGRPASSRRRQLAFARSAAGLHPRHGQRASFVIVAVLLCDRQSTYASFQINYHSSFNDAHGDADFGEKCCIFQSIKSFKTLK